MGKESANLDFLRACAVLSVYFGHILQMDRILSFNTGQAGVYLFFVHTSLVLMLSMERMKVEGWLLFIKFYIRRFFRIYPLSVFFVLFVSTLLLPAFPTHPYVWHGWSNLVSNLMLTMNVTGASSVIGPLGSLPYEVDMYLVLPALFLLIRKFPNPFLPIVFWVLAVLTSPLFVKINWRLDISYAPLFLSGVIAYRLLSWKRLSLLFGVGQL
jgi:peptidoglycan/LPS O-acetylase OafA/YrhL